MERAINRGRAMTKQRRLAIQMWQEIVDKCRTSDDFWLIIKPVFVRNMVWTGLLIVTFVITLTLVQNVLLMINVYKFIAKLLLSMM